ncbi:MAG: glycoside hydrolase family 3 C-terminal domain-containing protein, partial [Corallococcus sp.]|nr:glycoside hydrolase family 3 C-terminal domain-containing protein [Corallococcus sp.]
LQTGSGAWRTASVERVGVESVTVSDGPVGLRKEQDGATLSAVCFPSVAKLACSFDTDTLREAGAALGEQCRAQDVDVLLAPGINIKRDPRCGRNFEYFSEDPYLTAALANAYASGVCSQGVGVCVKHFAGNNQEYGRMVCDSVIDERALREIYLYAFERVVKESAPCSVMCAYNRLNGEYCSENKRLLTDILRNEWGYKGLVMSDWGAVADRVKSIHAGVDLEMPQGETDRLKRALEDGSLSGESLTAAAERVEALARSFDRTARNADSEYQHKLATRLSAETTVLAQNNCKILPLSKTDKIAVIGAFAQYPAFQGGGSSKVNAYKTDNLLDALTRAGVDYCYARGYELDGTTTEELLDEAQSVAASRDKVILVVGDNACTEGEDCATLSLPQGQLQVLDAVTSANSNVVAAVQCGSSVDVSWSHAVKAILIDYYGGEGCGQALCDVIFGDEVPRGRLAETWYSNLPRFAENYAADYRRAVYAESIFVGYRYASTANVSVAFPFGYGLSYGGFTWGEAALSRGEVKSGDKVNVSLTVTNNGKTKDADVVQIYSTNLDGRQFNEKKRLVAFKKVRLKAGESKKVTVQVNVDDLAYYDVDKGRFCVNGGRYLLTVGRHADDAGQVLELTVAGDNDTVDRSGELPSYYNVDENFAPSEEEFVKLYGKELPTVTTAIDVNSPLCELQNTAFGRFAVNRLLKDVPPRNVRSALASPLRAFAANRMSADMLDTLVAILNGGFRQNIFKLYKQNRAYKKLRKRNGKA